MTDPLDADDTVAALAAGLCGSCRFAVRCNEYGFYCHRHPPTVVWNVSLDGSGAAFWDNVWPFVVEADWCGEWNPATPLGLAVRRAVQEKRDV